VPAPLAARVRGADRDGSPALARPQQPSCEHRRLEQQHRLGRRGGPRQQLGGHERPLRIGIGARRVDAGEAGPLAREDERSDRDPVAVEVDRQVRDVGGEQSRDAHRVGEPVRDEQHRRAVARVVHRPPGHPGDPQARGTERRPDRRLRIPVELCRQLHPDLAFRGRRRCER
jgi:hypothetical protein